MQKLDSFQSSQKTFDDQGGSIPAQQHKGFNLHSSGFTQRFRAEAVRFHKSQTAAFFTCRTTKPPLLVLKGPIQGNWGGGTAWKNRGFARFACNRVRTQGIAQNRALGKDLKQRQILGYLANIANSFGQ